MPKLLTKPGNILSLTMLVLVVVMLVFVSVSGVKARVAALTADATDVDLELRRVGLDPVSMTAAGVVSDDVATIVTAAEDYLDIHFPAMRLAEETMIANEDEAARLKDRRRAGVATPADLTALAAVEAAAAAARTTLETHREALFDDAAAGLGSGVVTMLETIASTPGTAFPVQYRCAERTDADWQTLRRALANDRVSRAVGEDPDASLQTFLTACKGEGSVTQAVARLASNLAAVESAYATALGS